ncbi:MAG: hypothetical protein J5689_03495 [Clostridia bacterium]|nr:hypothetical protein [Clostridia bacterium]
MNRKLENALVKEEKRLDEMSFDELLFERERIYDKLLEINTKLDRYNADLYEVLNRRDFCLKKLLKSPLYHKRCIVKSNGRIAASEYKMSDKELDKYFDNDCEKLFDGLGQVAYMKQDGYSVKSYEPIEKYFPEQEMSR